MARGCGGCATAEVLKLPLCFPAKIGNEIHEQYQRSVGIVSLYLQRRLFAANQPAPSEAVRAEVVV
jgi:hypothetical protein